jgi:2-dehydro-3-deoxyglucarate aldolase/4-hydroxy-2-oxoheptanedioate aldolase
MENAMEFRRKIESGQVCLGTGISFSDPTVTESLSGMLDFVWIDMEHTALSLESVQGHIMATKGTKTAALVRVRSNDPVLIKPVLDIGADGIILPLIRDADDARRAVASCLYPPAGIRGFGPRRPSNYGRRFGLEFCEAANKSIIVILQIEHADSIRNIDEIIQVPGVTGIVFGPYDLSGSLGHMAEPGHPDVIQAIETVLAKAKSTNLFVGMALGTPQDARKWLAKGVQWALLSVDYAILVKSLSQLVEETRNLAQGLA